MLLALLTALQGPVAPPAPAQATAPAAVPDPLVYDGRARQLRLSPPKRDTKITVDGVLDEPVWAGPARLTGFSRFQPVDGIPAEDSTEVRVWYSSTAIHYGIRAREPHGEGHATLADRDRLESNIKAFTEMQVKLQDRARAIYGENSPVGQDLWAQFLNFQGPALQSMMGAYVDQSKKMFEQMQTQLESQTRNMFTGFQFPGYVRPEDGEPAAPKGDGKK